VTISLAQAVALLALIFGVMANTITDPAKFGVSDVAVHWISVLAQIASTVAAWLATAPKDGRIAKVADAVTTAAVAAADDDPSRFRD
jgi:hypothetical protein